jgi:lysophospholipid acyltransferase (LPLAT)-like uncharacterized protein
MIRAVKDGWDFGITPDGPRGPVCVLKPGVLALARKTGAWIVPVSIAYSRAWRLGTWDGMLVPMPFSKVTVRYAEPVQVSGTGEAQLGADLEHCLNELEKWAEGVNHA